MIRPIRAHSGVWKCFEAGVKLCKNNCEKFNKGQKVIISTRATSNMLSSNQWNFLVLKPLHIKYLCCKLPTILCNSHHGFWCMFQNLSTPFNPKNFAPKQLPDSTVHFCLTFQTKLEKRNFTLSYLCKQLRQNMLHLTQSDSWVVQRLKATISTNLFFWHFHGWLLRYVSIVYISTSVMPVIQWRRGWRLLATCPSPKPASSPRGEEDISISLAYSWRSLDDIKYLNIDVTKKLLFKLNPFPLLPGVTSI